MNTFTSDEKTNMLDLYFKSNRNSIVAAARYALEYPNLRQPNIRIFQKLESNLRNFGSFTKPRSAYNKKRNEEEDINILGYFNYNPHSSTRKVSKLSGTASKSKVHRILQNYKYIAYKVKVSHFLHEGDAQRRFDFCLEYLECINTDPQFPSRILWTDECKFTNEGTTSICLLYC